jgi:DNA polymerase-3 subunit epsilon
MLKGGFGMSLEISISFGEVDSEKRKNRREYKGNSLIAAPNSFVVVDIETTGLDATYDSIIEVSAIRVHNDEVIDTFSSLIKHPHLNLNDYPYIIELTGITQNMLDTAQPEDIVLKNFYSFIKNSVLIGHNINFDINFLYDSFAKYNVQFSNDFVDTLRLSRRLLPDLPHHRLSDISQYFNISTEGAHRALRDCEITLQCYNKLQDLVIEQYCNIENLAASVKCSFNFRNKTSSKNITTTHTEFDETHPLYKKVCVFTGTLEKMNRKDAMQIVVDLGGICADSVTKKTNFLILGNNDYCPTIKDGKSAKQKKAEALKLQGQDIEIISENTFYDMIEDN